MTDLNSPPTNKLLLECGPEGTEFEPHTNGIMSIPIADEWSLRVSRTIRGARRVCLQCSIQWAVCTPTRWLPLGHVSTLGEVISLYETLSQKKWPGCD